MMPSNTKPEALESPTEKFRREYAEVGADWAYFLVQFLRGKRRAEIQPEEIKQTQIYLRANDAERRALDFVCQVDHLLHPSPEDKLKLRIRDQFLCGYVDGLTLGHADLVAEIKSIPFQIAKRAKADRALFANVYEQPRLFGWIFARCSRGA